MNMKTATLLIREESLDEKPMIVEPTGSTTVGQVGDQVDGIFIIGSPPSNQVDGQAIRLGEIDLIRHNQASARLGRAINSLAALPLSNLDVGRCSQYEGPICVASHPFDHSRVVVFAVSQ